MTDIIELDKNQTVIVTSDTSSEILTIPDVNLVRTENVVHEVLVQDEDFELLTEYHIGGGSSGASGAAIFVSDVTPDGTGIVALKSWESGDVPAQADIKECTTDTDNVRVHIWAEGGIGDFTPTITVNGNTVTNLTQHSSGVRVFEGYGVVSVTETQTITVTSDTGTSDTVIINRALAGPVVSDITFGSYPGTQTELKAGDTISVSVTVDDTATSVDIKSGGANAGNVNTTSFIDNGNGTYTFSGTITISSASGLQTVTASGTNSLGTEGDNFVSTETLNLNQTYPTIGTISIVYPNSQGAIKGSEVATVSSTVSDFDTINYTTSTDLSHQGSTTTYEQNKSVQRVSGDYIVSGTNYSITANRAANDATTVRNRTVKIVNVAATAAITIDGNPARLRSDADGESYTVRLTSDQTLSTTPTMDASLGGFSGSFSGSGSVYTKTLSILDSTNRGTGNFSNLNLVGLSGIVGNIISSGNSYTVGGFLIRTITFDPFATHMPIGTSVLDFSKVRCRYTGTTVWLNKETTKAFLVDGFTIVDSDGTLNQNGDHVWLTDTDLSGANATGSLKVDIEEQV